MSKVLKTDLAFDLKPHSTRRTYSRERKLETDGLDHSSAQGPAACQRVNPRGVFTHKDTALHGDTQVGKILLMIGSLFIVCAQVPVSEGLPLKGLPSSYENKIGMYKNTGISGKHSINGMCQWFSNFVSP